MKVDAHQHYWKPDRGDYGFLTPDAGILYRDYLPEDLKPLLAAEGFGKTIVVQAAPTEEETRYLLGLAAPEPTIAGVVGWIDFEMESTLFDRELVALRKEPAIVGVRPMLQQLPSDYVLQPQVLRNLGAFAESGLVLDWLVYPRHLPAVHRAMSLYPNLRGVIDHLAKPDIASGAMEPWKEWMSRLAELPNLACKLSGMVTEAGPGRPNASVLMPYAAHVFERFREDRVLFGSDWPVCLLSASFGEVAAIAKDLVPAGWTEAQRDKLFGGNAVRWYGLSACDEFESGYKEE
jgi:L-fuconolactonase